MNRREAIRNVAFLMGGALTVSSLSVFQSGCSPSKERGNNTFTNQQQNLLDSIADIILPETDSPGAKEAEVGSFIVLMLDDCYTQDDRNTVLESLNEIDSLGKRAYNKPFMDLTLEQQTDVIKKLDHAAYTLNNEERKKVHEGYKLIKELSLFGYFTSEKGATQALNYVMTPGRYEGCVDLKPGQKAWA